MLGIYISGHPLEEYLGLMQKNCTRTSKDFLMDEEGEQAETSDVRDGETVVIGGLLVDKTVRTTKTNSIMAILKLEDLYGTTEVVVFPRDYERNKALLNVDSKLFIKGKAKIEEDRGNKVICQKIIPFEEVPCELWLRFKDIAEFEREEQKLYQAMLPYDGKDRVCIYAEKEKQVKRLSIGRSVDARKLIGQGVLSYLGKDSVAIKEKSIEK